jgi:hypothetical protein
MVRATGRKSGRFEGDNPPRGVVLNYHIRDEHDAPLHIEIRNSDGTLVRHYSSEESDFERCIIGNMDQRLPFDVEYPTAEQGANRWVWDLRSNGLDCIDDVALFEGFGGAYVPPGRYTATVRVGDDADTAELVLVADRRVDATAEQFREVSAVVADLTGMLNEILGGIASIRKSRDELEALLADHPDAEALQVAGKSAISRLSEWEKKAYQVDFETYEDEDSLPGKLLKQSRHLLGVIDSAGPPVAAGALERLADLKQEWRALKSELAAIHGSDIATVNQWAMDNAVQHIPPP